MGKAARKWVRRIGWFCAGVTLVSIAGVFGGAWAIRAFCIAQPPELAEVPAITDWPVEERDGHEYLGQNYLARENGILRMELFGPPYERGFAVGTLAQEYVESHEQEFVDTIRGLVPSDAAIWLLKHYVTFRNRNLPDYVREEHQVELFGFISAYDDKFRYLGPTFHRKLNYHAAHDIAHALIDNPLVGCTSFAAWGGATPEGHLIIGRNWDFNAARTFDTNKIVFYVHPEQGSDFIYVAWAGMLGVVSGINEHKITVTINAGHSDDSAPIGTPAALVCREVLQYAETLDDAVAILESAEVFVTDSYLIADGKLGEAVVVEKTPDRCVVRRAEGDTIVAANHFLSSEFENDDARRAYLESGTSDVRHRRMKELVAENYGAISPSIAVDMLRDRAVPDCETGGLGNPAAINMLAATHSVVIDATDGIVWVSAGPHQLGAFVPFGLDNFESPEAEIVPADPIIENGAYDDYLKSVRLLNEAEALLREGRYGAAGRKCAEADRLNPNYYRTYLIRGEIASKGGAWGDAERALLRAQALYVPFGTEQHKLATMLARAQAHLESTRELN